MAVAVKNTPETKSHRLFNRLAVDSGLGVLYVLVSLAITIFLLPTLWWLGWDRLGWTAPVGWSLLILLMIAVGTGLSIFGFRLVGPQPVHGLRAGVFFGLVGVLVAFLLTCWIGSIIESRLGSANPALGVAGTVAVGVLLLVGMGFLFLQPKFDAWIEQVEDQGWFSATPFKRSQGLRVRRATIFAILVLAGCGVFTLLNHRTLEGGPTNWEVRIPFAGGRVLPLLPDIRFTLPLLLTLASFWLAYRAVNFPVFADFLIATEAEMNKVSWTTRKRLVQDTIVVMVTVILLTVFLFVVDQVWAQLLTRIQVIQFHETTDTTTNTELPW